MTATDQTLSFQFQYERDQLIYERLRRMIGLGAADFFRDACQMVANLQVLNTRAHFIGHALREIESAIFDVLRPLTPMGIASASPTTPDPRPPVLPPQGSEPVDNPAEREPQQRAVEVVHGIIKALEIPESEPRAIAWLQATKESLAGRAHRRGLGEQRQVDQEFLEFWDLRLTILAYLLDRIESSAQLITKHLEELAAVQAPTKAQVAMVCKSLPFNMTFWEFFFSRLHSPAWIVPLRAKHMFHQIHPPIRDPLAQTVQFPSWPPGEYLARMAATGDDWVKREVLDLALSIPPSENSSVQEGLAGIALALPPALAKHLLANASAWLQTGMHMRLPYQLSEAITHLVAGGELEAALSLAKTLLLPAAESQGGATDA